MRAKIRIAIVGLLSLIAITLVIANWNLLLGRATLHLLVGQVEAPLGLILLVVSLVLTAVLILLLQVQRMQTTRRHREELEHIRTSAHDQLRARTGTVQSSVLEEVAAIRGRLDRIDRAFDAVESTSGANP
ncbi:MAG: hypothetical protein DHS20C21_21520 [Gemmatimonadota bacterium]|nr:MAG: hypothetical protein DHS20C21_21520 [Gemmatimonadota bacterium]